MPLLWFQKHCAKALRAVAAVAAGTSLITTELPHKLLHSSSTLWTSICGAVQAVTRDVPLAKNPSTGTAQQRLFLVLKVVLHAVVVISEVLRLSTKSRCSRCCRHISSCDSRMDAVLIAPRQTSPATIAYTHLRGCISSNLALVTSFCLLIVSHANGYSPHSFHREPW